MTTQVQFGEYVFPIPQNIDDNFLNFVPSTERMPGANGGWDNYGAGLAPQEIGNVSLSFILENINSTTLQTKIDEFAELASLGKRELRKWPHGATTNQFRFCMARFNNIRIPEDMEQGFSPYIRRIVVNFQVDDPLWYRRLSRAGEWAYAGGADNFTWNSGSFDYDGMGASYPVTTQYTTDFVAYQGSAPSSLLVALSTTAGQSLYNPTIRITQENRVLGEVQWQGVISNGESLIIDSKRKELWLLSTTRGPKEGYQGLWTMNADWLPILPQSTYGSPYIHLWTESSADRCTMRLSWLEAFYS